MLLGVGGMSTGSWTIFKRRGRRNRPRRDRYSTDVTLLASTWRPSLNCSSQFPFVPCTTLETVPLVLSVPADCTAPCAVLPIRLIPYCPLGNGWPALFIPSNVKLPDVLVTGMLRTGVPDELVI